MSLINDALKKAQRERAHPGAAPAPGAPLSTPPPAHGPAHQPSSPTRGPWLGVLIVLAVLGGGAAVWFLKPAAPAAPVAVAATAQPPPTPAPANSGPAPLPAEPVGASTGPAPAAIASANPAAGPSLQIRVDLPGTSSPVPTAAATPGTQPPPAAPALPAPPAATAAPVPTATPAAAEPLKITLQLEDPRVLAFLDAARINGVRSVADDAKLLMNNKVFKVGAVVDRELGLKLVQILPAELVFEDARGIQYRKLL